jgi:hypothetical protein
MRRWRGGRSRRVFSDDLGEQIAVGARALDDVEPRLRGRAGGGVERGLACGVENPGDAVGERARVADRNEDGVALVLDCVRNAARGKLRIVAESLSGPRLVSATAGRYGISTSLLFTWRRSVKIPET